MPSAVARVAPQLSLGRFKMRQHIVYIFISIFSEILVSNQTVYDYETSAGDGEALNPFRDIPPKPLGEADFNKITGMPNATSRKEVPLPQGAYFDFLSDISNAILSPRFKKEKIGPYFKILSNCLEGLGTDYLQKKWISRFRRKLMKYKNLNKNTLKRKVLKFLKFISDGRPYKNKYFRAMNSIYKMNHVIKMDDYVYELKRYGMGKTEHIGQKTRDVFEIVVFGTYHKQRHRVKYDIELHFKTAVLEFWEERLNLSAFNFTTRRPWN